jgi:hypothetical protein
MARGRLGMAIDSGQLTEEEAMKEGARLDVVAGGSGLKGVACVEDDAAKHLPGFDGDGKARTTSVMAG